MRVLLIGSNGLLATAVGKFCNCRDIELDVVGRSFPRLYSPRRFILADLMNLRPEALGNVGLAEYDLIVYAAGAGILPASRDESEQIFALNVTFPTGLVSHLRQRGFDGAVVTFGSYFEIGENQIGKEWTEHEVLSSTCRVPNSYCVSKRMLTRFASSIEVPFKYYHLILPSVYAEHEASTRLIPYTLANIRNGVRGKYTSGNQVRQYVHADDVVSMLMRLCERSCASGLYNVPGGDTLSVRDVVKIIYAASGTPLPDNLFGSADRDDTGMLDLRLDASKLCALIGGCRQDIRSYVKQTIFGSP